MQMRYSVSKNLIGLYTVKFECPNCNVSLSSPLKDAGNTDYCPDCGTEFVVPGKKEKQKAAKVAADKNKARQQARDKKSIEKQQAADKRKATKLASQQASQEAKAAAVREAEERAIAAKAKRSASEAGKQQSSAKEDNNGRFILGAVAVVLLVGVTVVALNDGDSGNPIANILAGAKVKKVRIKAGDATITDKEDGLSHVTIECNNGLVIDVDWKRNRYNDYGYDIYEPEVNRDYNRLAVMIMARGVIASYLRREYD